MPASKAVRVDNFGPAVSFQFGRIDSREGETGNAGWFALGANDPTLDLISPSSLGYLQKAASTEVITAAVSTNSTKPYVRQVKAVDGLADVVILSTNAYEVRIYHPTNVLSKVGGLWQVTNSPLRTVNFHNGAPGGTDVTKLNVVISEGGSSKTNNYEWIAANSAWTLNRPEGLSQHGITCVVTNSGTYQIDTHEICVTNTAAVSYKEVRKYTNFAWGKALVEVNPKPSTDLAKTIYEYYTATNDYGYSQTKKVTEPGGDWTYYTYDPAGRVKEIFRAFLNQGFTTSTNLGRYLWHDYTLLSGSGDAGADTNQLRTQVEYVLGREVSRRYWVYMADGEKEIQCVTPGAAWNAADNLVTTTRHYTNGSFNGWQASHLLPDGTLTLFQYGTNSTARTNIVWRGQASTNLDAVIAGTKTVSVLDTGGKLLSTSVHDVASGLLLSQDTYSNFDGWGKPGRVTHLDGSYEDTSYGCCGPESTTTADGVVTTYAYDDLKRQTGATTLGISQLLTYDASGRVVETRRQGTDSSIVVTGRSSYDLDGRLLNQTNAFGGVTSHAYATNGSGQLIITVTNPDGGTRVETYYADGQLAKVTGTAVNPVRHDYGVEQDGGVWRLYAKEIKLDGSGNDTSEWTKTYADLAGRTYKTVFAAASGTPAGQQYFNTKGQLIKEVDPDGVRMLYQYNGQGEVEYTAVDVDQDDTIDFSGSDRIAYTVRDVTTISSVNVARTRTYEYGAAGSSTQTQTGESRRATASQQNWDIGFGLTTHQQVTLNPGTGARTETVTHPDNSTTVSVYSYGRLQSVTRKDSTAAQIGQTTYAYDAHGRVAQETDARNGATSYTYNAADAVASVTTPSPGTGEAAQTVTSHYDTLGRVWRTVLPDGTSTTNEFFLTGQLKKTYGSHSYPVEYTYDPQGRLKTMKTWQDFAGNTGTALTTWSYDAYRGWLLSKDYPNAGTGAVGTTGTDYTYTAGGRLKTRTWARNHSGGSRIVTTYKYGFDDSPGGNQYEDLTEVSYNDSVTPAITYGYDRRGRPNSTVHNGTTTTLTLHDSGFLLNEAYTGGTLGGLSRTNTYDSLLRRTQQQAQKSGTGIYTPSYAYDNASRLKTVSHTTSANYVYEPNSSLVQSVTFKESSTTKLTTTRTYDRLNRLRSIVNTPATGSVLPLAYAYQYNAANQRVRTTLADGSYWRYDYDELGQVTGGKRYWNDDLPVPGQQYEYAFDDIGNRTATQAGGNATGGDLRPATYGPNYLNQYTNRSVPNAVDILGLASAGASVTVNSSAADYRRGEYFHEKLGVSNASAVWQSVSVSTGGSPTTGNLFVPPATESYTYDLDGNLTQDGRWDYVWDGENRLIQMKTRSGVAGPVRRLEFEYDAQGRRIRKRVYDALSGGTLLLTRHYLYDGWNLLVELDSGNNWQRQYLWGLDLSGSEQGAGGVGGLLMVRDISSGNPVYHVAHDGNGNVAGLLELSSGTWHANYEYGPFGETIRLSGSYAKTNPFRFSTKFQDDESDLLYYGFRYYNPATGRWLSRDPIEESGGLALYALASNEPLTSSDALGLATYEPDIVTKSFINGIPRLGSLGWRKGKLPSKYVFTFFPLSAKIITLISVQPKLADVRLGLWAAISKKLDAFNQNPQTPAKDGLYRLYSRLQPKVSCCGGKIKWHGMTTDKDGGREGPGIYGSMNLIANRQVYKEYVALQWFGWGKPHWVAEEGMQWVGIRTSANIWHMGNVYLDCNADDSLTISLGTFRHSTFPSHRLWIDGQEKDSWDQTAASDLWRPWLGAPTFVTEW